MGNDMNIEDILLEAQLLKERRRERERNAPAASAERSAQPAVAMPAEREAEPSIRHVPETRPSGNPASVQQRAAPVVPERPSASTAEQRVSAVSSAAQTKPAAPVVKTVVEPPRTTAAPPLKTHAVPDKIPAARPVTPRPLPRVRPDPLRPEPVPIAPPRPKPVPITPVPMKRASVQHEQETEEEEDVKIFVPASAKKAGMEKQAATPKSSESQAPTMVLPFDRGRISAEEEDSADIEGQIRMDELLEQEEGESDEAWEERLRRAREEKVRQFQKAKEENGGGFKLTGEDEDTEPEEEPEAFEEEELEDFGSYEEAGAVLNELNYRRRTGWIGLVLTTALEVVLIGLTVLVFVLGTLPLPVPVFLALEVFLLGVMMLINHRTVGGGLSALFRLRADADSGVSLTALVVLLHTALQFFNEGGVAAGKVELLGAVAGFSLLLGAVGRQMRLVRVGQNFRFVSYRGEKFAAHLIDDPEAAAQIGRAAVALGDPQVAYVKKTGFLTGFLEHSYSEDAADRAMRVFVPLAVLASAGVAVIFGLRSKIWWDALTMFAAALCLSCPAAAVLSVNFPLLRACRRALCRGGMLAGWDAVDAYGDIHALSVDAADLFPSESMLLHGIKTFSGTRIDEAIMDAAAVSISAGGPLAGIFRRVIENKTDMLQPVDTLVYEQDMGVSGWVGGRRVLVGNRRLLENHGVDVPSLDYENRYAKDDRQLVYLSIAGELSAMFVVSYTADEGIALALQDMTRAGVTLIVRTCDPNVTEDLLCRVFDLDGYYVELMDAPSGRVYEQMIAGETDQEEAVAASNGRVEGIASVVNSCRRLRIGGALAVAAVVVGSCLGLGLSAFLTFFSGVPLPALYMLAYLAVWTLADMLMPLFRRV